ncbi:hypothetical protein, partial [Pectobacterium odoriferum]|uniref:hypothetical protein n=1 Tax=Pectobacterium odoriferum TaxID=78398 RepID=UPI000D4FAABC
LASAADLRSGEIRFTICSHLVISIFDGGDNYPDRGGNHTNQNNRHEKESYTEMRIVLMLKRSACVGQRVETRESLKPHFQRRVVHATL